MADVVRTKSKVSGPLTPEEKREISGHTKMWIARIMRTEPADRVKLTAAIEELYKNSGLKKPRVVIVDSPLAMAYAYGASAAIWHKRKTNKNFQESLEATDPRTAWNIATNIITSKNQTPIVSSIERAVQTSTGYSIFSKTSSVAGRSTYEASSHAAAEAVNDVVGVTSQISETVTYNETQSVVTEVTTESINLKTRVDVYDESFQGSDSVTNSVSRATRDALKEAKEAKEAIEATATAADKTIVTNNRSKLVSAVHHASDNDISLELSHAAKLYSSENIHDATVSVAIVAVNSCFNIAGDFGLQCAKRWTNVLQGGAYWASYDCYLTSFRDVLGLELKEYEKYSAWEQAAIHGTFRVMHEEFCIVSDFPEILRVDEKNRPHCEFGPSHRWRDGWELYHWHGVKVPNEWIRDKSLDAKTAITWKNIEQRRAACEIVGWANILEELDATVLDVDNDPEIGTLVEVTIPDTGKEKFLSVQCGTGRKFALPVPPTMKTALEAQSWTWGLDPKDFKIPEIRT
jgi:hypothetical protein